MLLSCKTNFYHFPSDVQHCVFRFGSWNYDSSQLELILADADEILRLSNNPESTIWSWENFKAEVDPTTGNYTGITNQFISHATGTPRKNTESFFNC